jgi:hypothetical protein
MRAISSNKNKAELINNFLRSVVRPLVFWGIVDVIAATDAGGSVGVAVGVAFAAPVCVATAVGEIVDLGERSVLLFVVTGGAGSFFGFLLSFSFAAGRISSGPYSCSAFRRPAGGSAWFCAGLLL